MTEQAVRVPVEPTETRKMSRREKDRLVNVLLVIETVVLLVLSWYVLQITSSDPCSLCESAGYVCSRLQAGIF